MVTLSRPAALNSLTQEMLSLLTPLTTILSSAVIVRGAGGKAFCAGGDVRAVAALRGHPQQIDFFRDEYHLDWALAHHAATKAPHIALWDGIVMGGGIGISASATFRIATERTVWAMPETGIGLVPDVGGSFVLPRLPVVTGGRAGGPKAGLGAFLGLTGGRLAGADAVHAGAASHFMPSSHIAALVADLGSSDIPNVTTPYAQRLAAVARCVARYATPVDALPAFSLASGTAMGGVIERAFGISEGGAKGLFRRLNGEVLKGGLSGSAAAAALATLSRMSPVSLCLTVEQLRRGAAPEATLGACMAMELRVVKSILTAQNSDFYEGIRSVLVDKGKGSPPQWTPARIEDVDEQAIIKAYFDGGEGDSGDRAMDDEAAAIRKLGSHV